MVIRSTRDIKYDPDRYHGDIRSLKTIRRPFTVNILGNDLSATAWTEFKNSGQVLKIKFFQNTVQSGLLLNLNSPMGDGIEVYDGMVIEANIERFYLRFRDAINQNSSPITVYLAEYPELIIDNYPIEQYWLYYENEVADAASVTYDIYPVGGKTTIIIKSNANNNFDLVITEYTYSSVVAETLLQQSEILLPNYERIEFTVLSEAHSRIRILITNHHGSARNFYTSIRVQK